MIDLTSRWTAIAVAAAAGMLSAVVSLTPYIERLEEELGLRWLYQLRGPQKPPDDVLLVTMNAAAASRIFLPADPEAYHRCHDLRIGGAPSTHVALPGLPARWPRCVHAALVEGLAQAGAKLIVFDVLFRLRPPATATGVDPNVDQDRVLGQAIARAGNVLIAEKLEAARPGEPSAEWQPAPLSPHIANEALGGAPVPLIPRAGQLNRFAVFMEDGWPTPSLPMVALQAAALENFSVLRGVLAALEPGAAAFLPDDPDEIRRQGHLQALALHIRQFLRELPDLERRVEPALETGAARRAPASMDTERLLTAYAGPAIRQLNFHGPSGTLPSIGYDRALHLLSDFDATESERLFRGKSVFVGYSEQEGLEQVEHFPTAVSTASGPDLSGLEILATAYANLRAGTTIVRAPPAAVATAAFALAAAAALSTAFLGLAALAGIFVGMAFAYGAMSVFVFSAHQFWLPMFASLCIALPLGATSGIAFKYLHARALHLRARRVIRTLVPRDVADTLERNAEDVTRVRTSLECACVATDAARYTAFAEDMATERLRELLNQYYGSLLQPVAAHGGFVSDIVGDAMLAIWPVRETATRRAVCLACLDMLNASRQFSAASAGGELSTRFGVELGGVTLGAIGGGEHYEFRAVGDPVNTATRLQELNKQLGSHLLVTESVVAGLDEFLLRDLGWFVLRGKTKPVRVYELLGVLASAPAEAIALCRLFGELIPVLTAERFDEAHSVLKQIEAEFPNDTPALFFRHVLASPKSVRGGIVIG